MKTFKDRNNAKGAVAPMVAIMLVLIVVCVALVVDLGHIHNVKVQLQRAVDAAALAGVVELPDEDAAVDTAVAVAASNSVDQEGVVIDPDDDVELGTWNKEIVVGETAVDRFDQTGTPPTAVKVTASRIVDHIFFFFLPSTTVTADAIAVFHYEEETIPIALVSCIPTGGTSLNIASPGLSVCDITTYRFHSDTDDTAAWTSLTFNPASTPQIQQFLTEEGRDLFNEVVYGTNSSPEHEGIENTDVVNNRIFPVEDVPGYDNSPWCSGNNGTSIVCGLGDDISIDTDTIENIQEVDPTKLVDPSGAQVDPLKYEPLPRWYHFSTPNTFDYLEDAFTRLWTQDGNLVAPLATQAYLQALYETPDGVTDSPYGSPGAPDYRFKKFIELQGGTYNPNFNEVLKYAGYPPVWVNNGTIPPALQTFLDRIVNDDGSNTFKSGNSKDNEPFNEGNQAKSGGVGYTVKLTIPVIFAGACDDWKALSTGPPKSDIKLYYIGTADFLVTRAWKNPNCFEQAPAPSPAGPVQITNISHADGTCTPSNDYYDPSLGALAFQCTGGKAPNAALEGLIRPPTRGEEAVAGIKKIYLVE
jgi:hypothetical protein